MKRIVLFLAMLCFCLAVVQADQPSKADDKEAMGITVPRLAFASFSDEKSGSLRLLATDFKIQELVFTPTSVTALETINTPVLATVLIPEDKHRTHLVIAAGAAHEWVQIPSTAPYRMTGAFSFFLTSTVLPSPGEMRFRLPLSDGQTDFQPSTVQIDRFRDPSQFFGLDDKTLAFLMKGNFPSLTEEQALMLTRQLMQSEIKIEMKMQVRMRSVEEFDVGNGTLQVWGD